MATLLDNIQQVKNVTGGNVIVLGVTHLDLDVLPKLYELLESLTFNPRLDVVLYTRGGDINATRRIALLLREYCDELQIHAPYYCQSSGTLLCLSADHVYFSAMSVFSAIDPHLHGATEDNSAGALSSADIKHFNQMGKDWFNCDVGVDEEMLALLCQSIFPPTLTAFYRTVKETQEIALEMLNFNKSLNTANNLKMIEKLMFGYHSHEYCITGEEMRQLGLNFSREADLKNLTWNIAFELSNSVGGGNRVSLEEPWCDGILSNCEITHFREKSQHELKPIWRSSK